VYVCVCVSVCVRGCLCVYERERWESEHAPANEGQREREIMRAHEKVYRFVRARTCV